MGKVLKLQGVYTAVVTPFDAKQNVDHRWMRQHLAFQKRGGVDGVVVGGTNGEGHNLTAAERRKIVELASAHREDLHIIAGTGSTSVADVVEFARFCEDHRVDALLVMPPYFDRSVSEEGLARYFEYIAAHSRIPLLLYNIPQFTGVTITHGLLRKLSRCSPVAGVKDSSGDPASTRRFVSEFPSLSIFSGSDNVMLQGLRDGTKGAISGLGNVFPSEVVQVWRAFVRGEDAEEAQQTVCALNDAFRALPARAATKYALHLCGLPETHVRPPEVELSPEQKATLTARLT